MIDSKTAQQKGFNVASSETFASIQQDGIIEQLKALLPDVIDSDNNVLISALKDVVNLANTTSNDKGYELTFAGKGLAREAADPQTDFELHVEQQQSKQFDDTENVVIRGDNLDVLKILYQNYQRGESYQSR